MPPAEADAQTTIGAAPALEIGYDQAVLAIRFESAIGSTYRLEKCGELASGTWEPVEPYDKIAGTGRTISVPVALNEVSQRFYRLAVW
jgi:hypothetical protein